MISPTFIDVFSGCGGLSLGLLSAGWKGIFAIEKHPDAFSTLKHNLCTTNRSKHSFTWPNWLPQEAITVSDLLSTHKDRLLSLQGKIDLIAGGPPCQGFSSAGKRDPKDPRNALVKEYIEVVSLVQPRILLIENVRGFNCAFKSKGPKNSPKKAYSEFVKKKLTSLGYIVFSSLVCCSEFGIPQYRKRFLMVAIKKNDPILKLIDGSNPISLLLSKVQDFRKEKGLTTGINTSTEAALSDLETTQNNLIPHTGKFKGFKQIEYKEPNTLTSYQKLMRDGSSGKAPNSLRLARHTVPVIERFRKIQSIASLGKCINNEDRIALGIKKHSITPLHPHLPSATVTTLPDDILHYAEPRILTVRESARLQSFPDWFEFKGKYTTGGKGRKNDCPRYTQVGNAVPPLLSEAIGTMLKELIQKDEQPHKIRQNGTNILHLDSICAKEKTYNKKVRCQSDHFRKKGQITG